MLHPTASDTAPEIERANAMTPVVADSVRLLCAGLTPNSSEKTGSNACT